MESNLLLKIVLQVLPPDPMTLSLTANEATHIYVRRFLEGMAR